MSKNLVDAKILASSIASSLDVLYTYSVMGSNNTIEDATKISDVIFTIQAAAEKLSETITTIEENQTNTKSV